MSDTEDKPVAASASPDNVVSLSQVVRDGSIDKLRKIAESKPKYNFQDLEKINKTKKEKLDAERKKHNQQVGNNYRLPVK